MSTVATQRQIARDLDVSPATVSQVKNGAYTGKPETAAKVRAALDDAAGSLPSPGGRGVGGEGKEVSPFTTEGQQQIQIVLEAAAEDRELALIVAPSGSGKTFVAERFAAGRNDALYLKLWSNPSQGGLLRALCLLVGVAVSGNNDLKLERLRAAADGRFLILDEADLLIDPKRADRFLARIEIARELKEAGHGVALLGLPDLQTELQRNAASYVYSRIGYHAAPKPPSADDYYRYCDACGLTEKKDLAKLAAGRGGFRYLDKIARLAPRVGEAAAMQLVFRGGK